MTNTAYDLSRFAEEKSTEPKVRIVTGKKEIKAAMDRKFFGWLIGMAVTLTVLSVYTVYCNMLLTKTKNAIETKTSELTELQSQNVYLDYEIESMVSFENAGEYAEDVLGLVKFSTAQIEYVNLEKENKIVVEEKTSESILDKIKDYVVSIAG